jgi:hypothetical protein
MVLVTARAGGEQGVGWSYTSRGAATVAGELLEDTVTGRDAFDVAGAAEAMARQVRNVGRPALATSTGYGLAAKVIAAPGRDRMSTALVMSRSCCAMWLVLWPCRALICRTIRAAVASRRWPVDGAVAWGVSSWSLAGANPVWRSPPTRLTLSR